MTRNPPPNPTAARDSNFDRRNILGLLGAGAVAGLTLAGTSRPSSAQAITTDVLIDKGGAVYNVKGYGAVGDGVANDTAAISAARDAAIAGGGGVVLLPAGRYLVSSVIEVTVPGVTFVGSGQSATTVLVSSAYLDGDVFRFRNINTNNQSAGGVKSLNIISDVHRTGGAAIALNSVSNIVVTDVDMSRMFNGIYMDGTGVLQHIDRGYYLNFATGGTGIWINSSATNDTYISHIIMDNSDTAIPRAGLRITQSQATWVYACDFLHSQDCLLIDTPSGGLITWCFFSDTAFDNGIDRSMMINPATGATVNGLTFVNCWSSSAHTYDGCYIGGPVNGVELIGHRSLANRGNGFYIAGPAINVHIDSSVAAGNQAGHGFIAANSASKFAIRNCTSGPYAGQSGHANGISVLAGSNEYLLTGNALLGNTSSLSDSGGSTKVVANNLV